MKKMSGQSLVEAVVAVGVMALVISGVVMLMTNTLGAKTRGFDRKKAVEMSEVVMEGIVNEKRSNPDSFWNPASAYWVALEGPLTLADYSGYTYQIDFNEEYDGGDCGGQGSWNCAEVTVTIGWTASDDTATFRRFFSRY